jgi:hypothetical protein
MAYVAATICDEDVKSRRPPVNVYDRMEKSSPKPAPSAIPANITWKPASPANRVINRPTKKPNHAPESAPASATRPYVRRPVTRSTMRRSVPTMVTFSTGNLLSER